MLKVNTKQGRLRRSTCYKDPRDLVWLWKKKILEDFKFWHCLCWTIQDLWRIAYAYCKHKAKSGLRRPRPKGLGDQFILTQPLFVGGSQTVFNLIWFYNTVRMGFWLLTAEFTHSTTLNDVKISTELCILVLIVMMNFCKRHEMANTEKWGFAIWLQALHLQLTLYLSKSTQLWCFLCLWQCVIRWFENINKLQICIKILTKLQYSHQNRESWMWASTKILFCLHLPGSNW